VEGSALVASPYLADRNFLRSVVFVVKHDEEGAYGLILNRPTDVSVGQLLRQVLGDATVMENAEPIYHGGPVEGPVVIVHERPSADAVLYEPGVYLSSEQDDFAEICQQTEYRYRVFNGYAGWAPEQLDEELKQGGWLVWTISKEDLFSTADEIWQKAIRQIGREILADSITSGRIPDDPSCN
jgi:putative transcriptional regulator